MLALTPMGLLFLVTIFLLLYAWLIIKYWYHWLRLSGYQPPKEANTFISVVIAARNEEETLPLLLSCLEKQTYPQRLFEVIIVNDYSTDNTATVIKPFLNNRVHGIIPNETAAQSSKKKAIAAGIQQAVGELIVVTDADCLVPDNWLQVIAAYFEETGASIIAAPVRFQYRTSLAELLQAMDFMVLQGITASSVSSGFHTLANGANLAYQKKAFLDVNGFNEVDQLASGDDLFLMQKIWVQDRKKVAYLKSEEAIVTTRPMPTWKSFINQRRRWAGKSVYYKDNTLKWVLVFVFLFNLLFPAILITCLFDASFWPLLFYYLLGKIVIELPFVSSITKFYKEQKLLPWFILLQPIHILYTVMVGIISQFGNYEWKGRKTK